MCDFEKIALALSLAKAAFLAMLVLLAVGVINAGSPFTAAANVALMVLAIASLAVAVASYAVALDELKKCAGVCAPSLLDPLTNDVQYLLIWTSALLVSLVAVAVVAAVPVAGSAALLVSLLGMVAGIGLVISVHEVAFGFSANRITTCPAVRRTPYWGAVVILAGVHAAVPLLALGAWLALRR